MRFDEPKYPSSSLIVFFFVTLRLPLLRPPVTTTGGSGEDPVRDGGASRGMESWEGELRSSGAVSVSSSGVCQLKFLR